MTLLLKLLCTTTLQSLEALFSLLYPPHEQINDDPPNVTQGSHLSALYDDISLFYTLKHPEFTTKLSFRHREGRTLH